MITQEYLKSILHYDPNTGVFTWVGSTGRGRNGKRAGYIKAPYPERNLKSYRKIRIPTGKNCYEHQLAWLYMTGELISQVDHKDLDGLNNKWLNLRAATFTEQQGNRDLQANNTSGFRGVTWDKEHGRWAVKIRFNRKAVFLGRFDSKEEAAKAYEKKAKELFGEFARVE